MITEDYVSFETAKLLKEKGFDWDCFQYWHEEDNKLIHSQSMHSIQNVSNPCFFGPAAPTLQMTMKWLREVHDLHIIAYPWKADREERATHWCCQVYKSFNLLGYEKYTDETPKSYEEACEVAIKYCLEKLI